MTLRKDDEERIIYEKRKEIKIEFTAFRRM